MNWRRKRWAGPDDLVTAAEIACWAYCPEQWRLCAGWGWSRGTGRQGMQARSIMSGRRPPSVSRVAPSAWDGCWLRSP